MENITTRLCTVCLVSYCRRGGDTRMKILTWQARRNKKISLIELAALTGISKSTLNNIENGRTVPTIVQLEKIAKALDVRITDLFDSEYK